jgi:hypothetical protein
MMTTIPEPWVEHKAYPLSSYTKHKYPVNPTGLDKDDLLSHEVPTEALKKSDALAKQQLQVRAQLVKLHLPAAELARWLHRKTEPLESPAALKAWILDGYDVVRGDEQPHTGPETERFEGCVHSYVSYLHELLWSLSDRTALGAHTSMVHDYDLQMQRVQAVAPQTIALAQAAFGRASSASFAPHLSVSAERMKVETDPSLTVVNLADAILKSKTPHNERKRLGNDHHKKSGANSRSSKQKSSGKAPMQAEAPTPVVPGSKPPTTGQGGAASPGVGKSKAMGIRPGSGYNKPQGGGRPAVEE